MQIINENLNESLTMDIYELAWHTIYQMEVQGKLTAKYNINNIYIYIKTLTEENRDFFHILLYNKEIAIGILLGYYILLKSKFVDKHDFQSGLSRILKIIKNFIDKYSTKGEIIYALKKLDTITNIVKNFIDIDKEIEIRFKELKETFLKGNPSIENAEDLSYIIWIICDSGIYGQIEKQDFLNIALNDRLYDLATMEYKSASIYSCALSNFVLRYSSELEKENYKVLYDRTRELEKALKAYAEEISNQKEEGVSNALISKLKLGIYNLENALEKLKTLDETRRINRNYKIILTMIVGLIIIFFNLPTTYQILLLTFLSSWILVQIFLFILLGYMLDSILEHKYGKKLISLILEFLKSIKSIKSH
jgi:flagellar biosynthesis protein FliQ